MSGQLSQDSTSNVTYHSVRLGKEKLVEVSGWSWMNCVDHVWEHMSWGPVRIYVASGGQGSIFTPGIKGGHNDFGR